MNLIAIKNAVRERDGMRCTQCRMSNDQHIATFGRSLEVHRKIPGSKYTVEGCITLCRPCHGPKPRSARGRSSGPFLIRLHPILRKQLKILSEYNVSTITAEVAAAVRAYLEAKGLWPLQENHS